MSELEAKIKNISNKYIQLKKCQNNNQKQKICIEIIKLCVEMQKNLQKQARTQQKFKWDRQINDIKNKAMQISQKLKTKKLQKQNSQRSSTDQQTNYAVNKNNEKTKLTEEQLSKKIVRSIISEQLSAKQMSVSAEQFQKIAVKMEQNLLIMEEIKKLILQQGNNLQIIEEGIVKAFDQTCEANKQLQEASKIQMRTRLMKIRIGVAGALSSIGFFFMGIPGAILGLFGALKVGKLKKTEVLN